MVHSGETVGEEVSWQLLVPGTSVVFGLPNISKSFTTDAQLAASKSNTHSHLAKGISSKAHKGWTDYVCWLLKIY